ncbi:PREDICTED: uncharacterized protein LOC109588950 [Amphimedon queenslandica]|uniref:Uncharacterized protein n=1 Tax=Amphimedon queenslandica TaxID=400682 RepID=A0AAN0JUS1_AMPQE|nr:PREDICTED: uncharacterized protein LOC109588950 [Amphimedon queenslandica]|eukprot:XP_019860614.1 PREDICTED: uncharacterized protein LOC109588950 [Amphimedon queenslandica]
MIRSTSVQLDIVSTDLLHEVMFRYLLLFLSCITVTRGCRHRDPGDIGTIICLNHWIHDHNNRSLYCCQGNYCNGCPDIERLCEIKSLLNVTDPPPECNTTLLTCTPSSSISMTSTPGISSSPIPSSSVTVSSTSVPTPNGFSQTCITFIATVTFLFTFTV